MYKLIKHRGYHDSFIKENSLEGIKNALNDSKYIGVEFDVRVTLDNELVIFHNAYYKDKLVRKINYKELPLYVPKLEEILMLETDKIFLIEIKDIHNNYENFLNVIKKYDKKNLYIMSFSNKTIFKLDIPKRNYKIGVLNYVFNTSKNISKLDFVCILNSLLNQRIINYLKNQEILSYGLFTSKKYKEVIYIVD